MQQITLAPTMFKHCLTANHVFLILAILVPQAMASVADVIQGQSQPSQTKFRLLQLISTLQKTKVGGKKGFIGDDAQDRLWLLEINLKVFRLVKDDEAMQSIASHHKKILKQVKKEVTAKRKALFSQAEAEKDDERKIKLAAEAKRALALEKMILSFTLAMCLPDDVD